MAELTTTDFEETSTVVRDALSSGLVQPDTRAMVFHDLDRLRQRVGSLQRAFPVDTLHAVAVKANPVVGILRELVTLGTGLETASMEEVHVALGAGCPPERIVYDSPVKTIEEIDEALRLGLYINVDNFDELQRIERSPALVGSRSRIGIRVNPGVGVGSIEALSVGGRASKFGVSLALHQEAIIEAFRRYAWLTGVHVHVGSQGCPLELLVSGSKAALELKRTVDGALGGDRVSILDIGGGLPVAYGDADDVPDFCDYAVALKREAPGLFGNVELITEFGRSVHANCGWAISRVEYVKDYGDRRIAVTHFGADFLMRRVYQPELWNHRIDVVDRSGKRKNGRSSRWTIGGPLCFAGDVLADDVELPDVEVGDWIVIGDVGAYTLSLWSRHCNRGMPAVVGYGTKPPRQFTVLRRAESPSDIARFWS